MRYSAHVVGSGREFFDNACRMSLEGIVSKRRDARYEAGRGGSWLKVKCLRRQEVVIGGFTDPRDRARASARCWSASTTPDGGSAIAGKVGTGFTDKVLRDLRRRLEALEQDQSPFTPRPEGRGRAPTG